MTSGSYETLVDACDAAADACDRCLSACLLEPAVAQRTRCIALALESAQLCRLLAGFSVRGSTFTASVAAPAAELCEACATECARHDAPHCTQCAAACRSAAEACRHMLEIHAA